MTDSCKCGSPSYIVYQFQGKKIALCNPCFKKFINELEDLARKAANLRKEGGKHALPK